MSAAAATCTCIRSARQPSALRFAVKKLRKLCGSCLELLRGLMQPTKKHAPRKVALLRELLLEQLRRSPPMLSVREPERARPAARR